MALPECSSGQQPYEATAAAITGDTPGQVCGKWTQANYGSGYRLVASDQSYCVIGTSTAATYEPVVQVCEPVTPHFSLAASTGLTAGKVADYMALWGAFLVAAVVVLCAKALYKRFRIDYGD